MTTLKAHPIPSTAALFLVSPISDDDTQVDYVPDAVDDIKHDEFAPGTDKPLTFVQAISPVLSFKVVEDESV